MRRAAGSNEMKNPFCHLQWRFAKSIFFIALRRAAGPSAGPCTCGSASPAPTNGVPLRDTPWSPPSSPAHTQLSRTLRIQIPYPIANRVITRAPSLQMPHGIANHVITETFSFQMTYRIDKQMSRRVFSIQIQQYVAYVIKKTLGFDRFNFPAEHP